MVVGPGQLDMQYSGHRNSVLQSYESAKVTFIMYQCEDTCSVTLAPGMMHGTFGSVDGEKKWCSIIYSMMSWHFMLCAD